MHTTRAFWVGILSGFVLVTVLLFLGLALAEEVTIYDKDWRVKERMQDKTIYEKDWKVKGHIGEQIFKNIFYQIISLSFKHSIATEFIPGSSWYFGQIMAVDLEVRQLWGLQEVP